MVRRTAEDSDMLSADEGGAFSEMLAWVADESGFVEAVRKKLDQHHLDVGVIEDVEPLQVRQAKRSVHPVLLQRAAEIEGTQRVEFHEAIHTYPLDDSAANPSS
jgi:hypothetical protein